MINGFKNETHELTAEEFRLLPLIVDGLKTKIGKVNAITNNKMVKAMKAHGHKITPPRLRKIIHHIRITGLIERLVATSKGYYITNDKEELEDYIESLTQRAESITRIADQLAFQKNKM